MSKEFIKRAHFSKAMLDATSKKSSTIRKIQFSMKGFSGATKTSWALMEGIRRRLTQEWHDQEQERTILWRWVREGLGYSVLIGAFLTMVDVAANKQAMDFLLETDPCDRFRHLPGQLLSLSWFAGMAHGDSPSQLISSMGLIGMSALLSPITVRKNLLLPTPMPRMGLSSTGSEDGCNLGIYLLGLFAMETLFLLSSWA